MYFLISSCIFIVFIVFFMNLQQNRSGAHKKTTYTFPHARYKAYAGFRTLVVAELQEFGPPGLSFKGREKEVPLFFFH